MADLLSTSVSGLLAFQQALDVTSNNISNAETPGYDVETANFQEEPGQQHGIRLHRQRRRRIERHARLRRLLAAQVQLHAGELFELEHPGDSGGPGRQHAERLEHGAHRHAAELRERAADGRQHPDLDRRAPGAPEQRPGARAADPDVRLAALPVRQPARVAAEQRCHPGQYPLEQDRARSTSRSPPARPTGRRRTS